MLLSRKLCLNPGLTRILLMGGTLMAGQSSLYASEGEWVYVICDKHPQQRIPVKLSMNQNLFDVKEAAQVVLKKCPECVTESMWQTSRFSDQAGKDL